MLLFQLDLLSSRQNGNLQALIERCKNTGSHLKPVALMTLFHSICLGLREFHERQPALAFRDLKPDNVLIDSQGQGILADLGSVDLARVEIKDRKQALSLQEHCAEHCTAPYRAPELFEVASNAVLDERTDIWSLGCLLYAIAFLQCPFDGTATSAIGGRFEMPTKSVYREELRVIIRCLLQTDIKQRPFITDVLELIKPMNWA